MTRSKKWAVACAFGAAFGWSSVASAQMASGGGPGGSQRISGSVHGQVSYDDNIAGGDATIANLRGVTPADITYDLGGVINLQLPSSPHALFLTAAADLLRYEQNPLLNSNNYSVSAGGSGRLARCQGSAVLGYNRHNTQSEDLTIAVTQNIASQESVSASVSCGAGSFFAGVQSGYSKLTNSAIHAGFVDSESYSAGASAGYGKDALGTFVLTGLYSKATYDNTSALSLGQPSGYDQYSLSLSYSRRISQRLNGSASISLQDLQTPGTMLVPANSSANLGSTVGLNYRVSSRLGLSLAYNLGNQASPTVNASYVRVQSAKLGGDYTLNQRVALHMSVSTARTQYQGGVPVILQVRNTNDDAIEGGISVKIGRKLSVTLNGSHTERRADLSDFNFSANQVALGLTGTF